MDKRQTTPGGREFTSINSLDKVIGNMKQINQLLKQHVKGKFLYIGGHEMAIFDWLLTYDNRLREMRFEDCSLGLMICNEFAASLETCMEEYKYEEAKRIVKEAMKCVDLKNHQLYTLITLYSASLKVWNVSRKKHFVLPPLDIIDDILRQTEVLRNDYKPTITEDVVWVTDWPGMKKMYESQRVSMSRKKRNLVAILAAKECAWKEFQDCLKYGADIVRTKQILLDEKSTSFGDRGNQSQPTNQPLEMKARNSTAVSFFHYLTLSPLHEALKTGEFPLEKVKSYFEDTELVNAVDSDGHSLLHAAIKAGETETRMKNVQFLLKHNVDINVQDADGKTPLQYLVHSRFTPSMVDIMVELVNGVDQIAEDFWRPGEDEWTALHVLCMSNHCDDQLVQFVQKGASPKELRKDLTLIDTVILCQFIPPEKKLNTLKILLEKMDLGPFHAHVVEQRASSEKRNEDLPLLLGGKVYVYPLEYLLFPDIIANPVMNKKYSELLLKQKAVCEKEMAVIKSKLHLADKYYQDLRTYLVSDTQHDQTSMSARFVILAVVSVGLGIALGVSFYKRMKG